MSIPIEVTTRYVTTVDGLPAAWAFVMERLDKVGPDPTVVIKPHWWTSVHDMGQVEAPQRKFEVVVEGTVEEQA
jgi:hypothetical protein